MKFIAGNAQHIGARPQQQDAFGFSDPGDAKFVAHAGFLGVVADGMGGLTHGSEASRSAVLAFLTGYKRKSVGESIPRALTRCLGEANTGVLNVAQSVPPGEEVGTTLVAAVLHDHILYWVSVGDSRIYLLRGTTITQLTADHVYARELNRQVAEGKISLGEALSHPERSSLTSYLGQSELMHVDKNIRPLQVQGDDCVMLCSDGFYRALTEHELVTGLRSNPQIACATLVEQALAKHRKQQDNLTVIALKRETRGPISGIVKVGLATAAMLLIAAFGAMRYWIPPNPPPLSALTKRTPLPTFALDKTVYPPVPVNRVASGQAGQTAKTTQTPQPPKASSSQPAPGPKKNDTEKGGGKTPTAPPQPPPAADATTQPGQGKPTQPPPAGGENTGNSQDKSGSTQNSSQDQQNGTGQTQTPGTAPAAPTAPATPAQPNDEKKKDSTTPPAKDDQPKSPPAPQKDNQADPSQPPGTGVVEGHAQVEG